MGTLVATGSTPGTLFPTFGMAFGPSGDLFVAILDDDDEWEPDHLALCTQAATSQSLDMVAPAIVRMSGGQDKTVRLWRLPAELGTESEGR